MIPKYPHKKKVTHSFTDKDFHSSFQPNFTRNSFKQTKTLIGIMACHINFQYARCRKGNRAFPQTANANSNNRKRKGKTPNKTINTFFTFPCIFFCSSYFSSRQLWRLNFAGRINSIIIWQQYQSVNNRTKYISGWIYLWGKTWSSNQKAHFVEYFSSFFSVHLQLCFFCDFTIFFVCLLCFLFAFQFRGYTEILSKHNLIFFTSFFIGKQNRIYFVIIPSFLYLDFSFEIYRLAFMLLHGH